MKKLSALYRDQPDTPLKRAVFWTEYVLQHGGGSLRSVSADLPWYQYFLLDVIAVLFIGTTIILASLYLVLGLVYRTIKSITRSKKQKKQ
jgi:glucuronosyltransferase